MPASTQPSSRFSLQALLQIALLFIFAFPIPSQASGASDRMQDRPPLFNVVPALDSDEHVTDKGKPPLPIPDKPYLVHVRGKASQEDWDSAEKPTIDQEVVLNGLESFVVRPRVTTPVIDLGTLEGSYVGTDFGLWHTHPDSAGFFRWQSYGKEGPPATQITGLAADSKGLLWIATSAGLASLDPSGIHRDSKQPWQTYRGPEGLPWEELTCIAIDPKDRLWLGSTQGLIQFRPYEQGRQWYYRAGRRYLPNDHVLAVAVIAGGSSVLVKTEQGIGRIDEVPETLHSKAEYLENRFNDRHRRLGLPSPAQYKDGTLTEWTHTTQPSDGLWASYHVTAMSLAYALTGEERYRESAKRSMEGLYLLQNVTGIPGLVARTVAEVGTPEAEEVKDQENWHASPDPKYIWRDDVSSDQIDGHYFAFHSYFEHIAKHDPVERERIEKQIRQVTDYILDNNYQIIDWDGERTLWGWWNPELLNNEPDAYIESGLYSLMMLSFLKVAHTITDDTKYVEHARSLIEEHGYLSNLLLEKKLFPDELNHSDDQLSAVAYYPILQLEKDPYVMDALRAALRRHAAIEIPERNSFFAFVHASLEPEFADVAGGLQTLREFPQDRRQYAMKNSHRKDVVFNPHGGRFGRGVLLEVLPYDEHHFERWNQDPYQPDTGGDGLTEGSGEHYLVAYWLARYHGLLSGPVK